MPRQIILASASPARRQLLTSIGLAFEIEPSDFAEVMDPNLPPQELTVRLALGKARSVAAQHADAIIIAADSFAVLDGIYLGKPRDEEEARSMLHHLSGRTVQFVTGLAVIDTSRPATLTDSDLSEISILPMSEEEIEGYLRTGEPLGKAGALAVQGVGSVFVESIAGSPTNVAGLPLNKLRTMLQQLEVEII